MPIALESVPDLIVRNLTRGFNQAAVLTAEHAIRIDDPAALPANAEVTFTDPDLGFIFSGRITKRSELWRGGEGIVYTCADVFRTMAKEPAKLAGSTKIEIVERTSGKQLIEDLLDEYIANGNPLAGGYDTTNLEDVQIEPMDMGGQSLFEWIDSVLRQTEESVCWIEYDGSDDPVLMFDRLSLRPTLELVVGDYEVVDPETDDNPLIVGADIGESLDNKYSKVEVEGCGDFVRWDLRWLPHTAMSQPNPGFPLYIYEFDIPEQWGMQRYLDDEGNCQEDWWVRITYGGTATSGTILIGSRTTDVQRPTVKKHDGGGWYFEIAIITGGIISVPPPIPQIQCWFTYTAYNGPLVASRSSSVFSGEGTLIEQHPDLFKYTAAVSGHDDLAVVEAIADRLYERFCVEPDRQGRVNIHIKGFDPDVDLGVKVTAPASLHDPFVRGLRYDFVKRDIVLDCTDIPLRPEIGDAQAKARLLSELLGNWYLSKDARDPSCFCGGDLYVDEDGEGFQGEPPGGGGGGRGPSWDCIDGECIKRTDDSGQYDTFAACDDVCWVPGYDFIPCVGCVGSQDWGQYETMEDCLDDNPDPFAPEYNCTSGVSGASPGAPEPGRSVEEYGCSGCACDGSAGQYFLGFIKRIKVDSTGKVVKAECDTCTFTIVSGWTGVVSVLANATITMVGSVAVLSKCWHVLIYSDGILIKVDGPYGVLSPCDFKSEGTGNLGILATDWSDCPGP